ncbi:holin [Clostridium sp.]|uniref:holin n=1 Tax=Clostridium sp. TaxID=1506 RepID=UPI003FA60100
MSRWKNYGLWIAIASFIPLLLQGFGLDYLPGNYDQIVNSLLGILVMAGIISNPTTETKWFLDDKSTDNSPPIE